jgi:hypothetical protein
MYAHVTAGTVDSVGQPPQLVFQDGRWWDLRDRDPATLALVGWYPVTESPKPADTASTKWTPLFTLNGATVIQSWVEVSKTPEEIAADVAEANRISIEAKVTQALTDLAQVRTDLATLAGTANTTINASPAVYIKQLGSRLDTVTAVERRLIRYVFNRLDSDS